MYEIWRMQAMNDLQEYKSRQAALKNLSSKISEIRASMSGIKSALANPGEPRGSGDNVREDVILNNLVVLQKLEDSQTSTERAIQRTETALGALSTENKKILEYFYISPRRGAASDLAFELGIEEKTVYNRRNIALQLFTKALYGDIA